MNDPEMHPERLTIDTAALGGSPLSRAIQAGTVPAAWRLARPNDLAGWRRHAELVRHSMPTPAVDWLSPLWDAVGGAGDTPGKRRLREASARGFVVTTGQQPGLFGGPAYTVTKALSALALADELTAQLGVPVAPVFWAATDDADWHEAAVTHVVGREGLERLSLAGPPTDGVPMQEVPLGPVAEQRQALRAACGSLADPSVLELVDACYTGDATIGSAYVAWLRGLLEPLGIAVLDASHPALRTAADGVLRSALRAAPAINAALAARVSEITDAGFRPQVELVDGLSLVFSTAGGSRTRVPLNAAAAVAHAAAVGTLGSNVLLRPVLERALLPTLAYVGGPGELAYFAQVSAVAEALKGAQPLVVPRWAAQWVEPQVARTLARLGVTPDALRTPEAVEGRLARAAMDRNVADAVDRLQGTLDAQVATLAAAVSADRALVTSRVFEGLQRDIAHRISRVERRLVAAVKRREIDTARDLAVAWAALFPNGSSPERVLSLVPLLSRYGTTDVIHRFRQLAGVHASVLVHGSAASAE